MKSYSIAMLGLVVVGSLICSPSPAQEPAPRAADIEIEIEIELLREGKFVGSNVHTHRVKELAAHPLRTRLTGLDGRTSAVTISYVGYADFEVVENAEGEQLVPGHVIAVQVLKGVESVTKKTAEKNFTKLIVYGKSPQILYEDEDARVTIRNKK